MKNNLSFLFLVLFTIASNAYAYNPSEDKVDSLIERVKELERKIECKNIEGKFKELEIDIRLTDANIQITTNRIANSVLEIRLSNARRNKLYYQLLDSYKRVENSYIAKNEQLLEWYNAIIDNYKIIAIVYKLNENEKKYFDLMIKTIDKSFETTAAALESMKVNIECLEESLR